MRLLEIEIENYGIFSDRQLSLQPSFQLVYGENEAGKSTLLQLIRELLFGFPHRSPYAFANHYGKLAASARVELDDGTRLRFRRQKGRKDTVCGVVESSNEALDEAGLNTRLGNPHATLFHNVFAISLDELAAGEKSLIDANLSEALYGGGLGSVSSIQAIRDAVREEHESLYAPRATQRRMNQLIGQLRDQQRHLRQSAVRPADYERMRQELDEAKTRVEEAIRARETIRRRHGHVARLLQALGPWKQIDSLEKEKMELRVPCQFPDDGGEQLRQKRARINEFEDEAAAIDQEMHAFENRLSQLELAPDVLQHEQEISSLVQQIAKIERFQQEAPTLQQEADSIRDNVLGKLHSLEPNWGLEELDKRQVCLAQQESIEQMGQQRLELERRQAELQARLPSLISDVATFEERLTMLGEIPAHWELIGLLQKYPAYEQDVEKRDELESHQRKLSVEINTLRGKLDSPLGRRITNAEKLPVPLEAAVQEYRQRLDQAAEREMKQLQRVEEIRDTQLAKQGELDQLETAQDVPDIEEMRAKRAHRDVGWQLIRAKYVRGKPRDDEIEAWLPKDENSLPDVYESQVRDADDMADLRQKNSEIVARREQLIKELDRLERRRAEAQSQLQKLEDARQALLQEWSRQWASCPFDPLSPNVMLDWLRVHASLLERLEDQSVTHARIQELDARMGDFDDELAEAIPEMTGSIEVRIEETRRRVETKRSADIERQTIESKLPAKKREREQIEQELASLDQKQTEWENGWCELLAQCQFPADWNVSIATKVVSGIGEAQQQWHQVKQLERRLKEIAQELDSYSARVGPICSQLAPDLVDSSPELAVKQLHSRLDSAKHAQHEQKRLSEQLDQFRQRNGQIQERCGELQQTVQELYALADADSEASFHEVARQAARKKQIEDQVDSLKQQIRGIRGSEETATFHDALTNADEPELQLEQEQLSQDLERSEEAYRRANEQAGVQIDRMRQLEVERKTLEWQAAIENTSGELSSAVDRWAPLVLAERMINRAIEEFECEHQPRMLTDVGILLEKMTCGAYHAIRRKMDERGTLQIEDANGQTKDTGQLSRGTREQLYLAIRLAYIRHYCRQSESLPLILDDILVNFDDARARSTLEVLADMSESVQMLFLTCHQSTVDRIVSMFPNTEPFSLRQLSLEVVGA